MLLLVNGMQDCLKQFLTSSVLTSLEVMSSTQEELSSRKYNIDTIKSEWKNVMILL